MNNEKEPPKKKLPNFMQNYCRDKYNPLTKENPIILSHRTY